MNEIMAVLPLFIVLSGAYLTFVAGMAERNPRKGKGAGILAALILGTSFVIQLIVAYHIWGNAPLEYTLSWGIPSFSIYLEANPLGMLISIVGTLLATLVLLPALATAMAQPGDYGLSWWTVDGGGGSVTDPISGYALGSTAGQPDAATWRGQDYMLAGGLWGGALAEYHVCLPLVLRNH